VTLDVDYLHALGEARSCLAALADTAADELEASHYERLLIALDVLEPDGPCSWTIRGDRVSLLARLAAAVDRLVLLGADRLPLELVVTLAQAREAAGGGH
jgi:hypothetical protein